MPERCVDCGTAIRYPKLFCDRCWQSLTPAERWRALDPDTSPRFLRERLRAREKMEKGAGRCL